MGKVVEKKKKKKGRPSLLDLQKRSLRQQQEQNQQKQNPNSNPYRKPTCNPNPNGRYTRRNPHPDGNSAAVPEGADAGDDEDDDNEEEEDNSSGKRKEKKLKFVLRLPSNQQHRTLNSSLNSGSYGSDSNADEENSETLRKKRKVNALVDGSDTGHAKKGEETKSGSEREEATGSLLESGPTTPLPDKKLLLFILDRLQKKDTYGVFSEPVDPNELPDYHEIIKHPMDFGTVRKKLDGGAYANLEQFEKDVLLICSNAMQYNAPDTIYYRQARSMLEVAKKDFENLRQEDSEGSAPEPRVARRGRPPTKHLKKPPGRPRFDRAGSEDATLATAGDSAIWPISYDPRKDRSGLSDAFGRKSHNTEAYTSLLSERKSEKNDGFPGMSVKYGKKQFILDENRRNTYKQFHPLAAGCKPSVFAVFDGEPKQLTTVGLQAEYGYARSLARFAANLGPVAWKIASQKIERALPAGVNFGPGWVGENDATQPWQQAQPQPPPRPQPQLQTIPSVHPSPISKISMSTATPDEVESKTEKTSEKYSSNCLPNGIHSRPSFPSAAISSAVPFRTPELITGREEEAAKGFNCDNGSSLQNSSVGAIGPRPPFQIHQSHLIHNTMNGCTGGFGINLSHNMEKLARPGSSAGSFGSEAAVASEMHGTVARSNNFMCPKPSSHSQVDKSGASNIISSGDVLPDSCQESQLVHGVRQHPPSWGVLSVHQKIDPVPPDLNIRFQSQGSPSSSVLVDSPQPDLALQL